MKLLAGLLASLLVVLLAGGAARAQTAAGDWTGLLTVNPATTFRLAVHIHKAGDGYAGTLDDQSRAAYGVAITDIALSADVLTFKVPIGAAPAAFSGKWDAVTGRWIGRWTQGGSPLPLTLAAGIWPPEPTVDGLDGVWDGVLKTPTGDVRLVLYVRTGVRGASAWMDSPDQAATGFDVTALKRDGADFSFAQPALQATFAGKITADGQSVAGSYTQAGVALPLTFARRAVGASAKNRPQEPKPPFPYATQEVSFAGGAPGVRLAGTVTLPPGSGPFPAVVLVSGSGPNTRDEVVADHRIFLVLADYLTRHGIAVLRYDKRGIGLSTGDYAHATMADFADDAEAALVYLRTRPEIEAGHVGLIGHSEGGAIVPIVAVRDPQVAFIVMMAGPGVDGAAILLEQARLISKASGMSDAEVAANDTGLRALIAIAERDKDPTVAKAEMVAAIDRFAAARGEPPPAAASAQADSLNTPWFRYFFTFDPAPTLAKVRCPVLALDGSNDLQVPVAQNLPPIRAALAHNRDATVEELPGLNHLFQPATTGAPSEYAVIRTTIDPAALDLIGGWIVKHVGPPLPHQ